MATDVETKTEPKAESKKEVAVRQPREVRVVHDEGPIAHLMDSARFEHLQRIALLMASASLIPDHLKGRNPQETLGNCFLVTNQALRWGLDPFAVAGETYCVKGKLGFQGKLVAALINARAGLAENLRYEFRGEGDGRTVTVIGRLDGEDHDRMVELSVEQAKTDNGMWKKDPDQKLIYSAATKWARRHCPEVLLGVLTDDDLDRIAENRAIAAEANRASRPTNLTDLKNRLNNGNGAHGEVVDPEAPYQHAEPEDVGEPAPAIDDATEAVLVPFQDLLTLHGSKLDNAKGPDDVERATKRSKEQAIELQGSPEGRLLALKRVDEMTALRLGEGFKTAKQQKHID